MKSLPTTTSLLLEALSDPGRHDAWDEFDRRYRPILDAFVRRLGLSDDLAHEVTQDALATCAEELRRGRYDREQGRLRSWIFAIVRARVGHLRRSRQKRVGWQGDSVLADVADESDLSVIWEEEWRSTLLRQAFRHVREHARFDDRTMRAFELVTLEGRTSSEVAEELTMTANAVHAAKFRVLEKLRAALAHFEDEP
ncbi:MAG: sigma-70 family RNA polymerase sigma factor [bacterium]|nr:sigma-70 family RNA polymerase sigma factor [bacterium]